jgi:ATP-dependent DNA helicase 2 subunit 2
MTFNPILQYFNQVISAKMAMKPEDRAKQGDDGPLPQMN